MSRPAMPQGSLLRALPEPGSLSAPFGQSGERRHGGFGDFAERPAAGPHRGAG